MVGLEDTGAYSKLKDAMNFLGIRGVNVLCGRDVARDIARLPEVDVVVHAIPGFSGVAPLLAALDSGKRVALAGKEALVCAGELLENRISQIVPVDSEHSAVFQCLHGEDRGAVEGIILTASGGPFRDLPASSLERVMPSEALKHPTWRMGPKITVDSASLFNKSLEVIEAHYLFGINYDSIEVVVHRQSIVHSMVRFKDGSIKAQLGPQDMRIAISYALSYPERLPCGAKSLSAALGSLTFEEPDYNKFPCLSLGYRAGKLGGTAPLAISCADEIAVQEFLSGRIRFTDIYRILDEVISRYEPKPVSSPDVLFQERDEVSRVVRQILSSI